MRYEPGARFNRQRNIGGSSRRSSLCIRKEREITISRPREQSRILSPHRADVGRRHLSKSRPFIAGNLGAYRKRQQPDAVGQRNPPSRNEAAVYLLLKYDGRKLKNACKTVAAVTGENSETLRNPFKGLALPTYEKSKSMQVTAALIERIRNRYPSVPHWKLVYDELVQLAASRTPIIEADNRRIKKIG